MADDEHVSITETAARLNHLELLRAELDTEIKALRGQLAAQLQVGEQVADQAGRPLYKLAPGKRTFKQDLAAQVLPPELQMRYQAPATIDAAALKRDSTALWEACCVTGDPFLVVVR